MSGYLQGPGKTAHPDDLQILCSGSANCHIQDKLLPVNEGDLVIVGSGLFHRIEVPSSSPITLAALFFEPDLRSELFWQCISKITSV